MIRYTKQFLHRDHHGSATKLTNDSGSVIQSLAYEAGQGATSGRGSRSLTAGEQRLILSEFGNQVDTSRVTIKHKPHIFRNTRARVLGDTITFSNDSYLSDFSTGTAAERALFVHEITHIWQRHGSQTLPIVRAAIEQLRRDTYSYSLDPSRSLESYRMEQQAQIVQDFYFMRQIGISRFRGNTLADYATVVRGSIP